MANTQRERGEAYESRLRLQTAVRLRWFGVVGQLVTVVFVAGVLDFALPVGFCLAFVALSAWLNVYLRIRYPARYRLSSIFATTLLAYDILQLAALLYMTGGVENPFTFLIVAPVTVSAATLPPRNTVLLGIIATAASAFLIHFHLPLPWYAGESLVMPPLYRWGVFASVAAGMIFLALYAWRLSKEARQMTAALAATEDILAREQRLHALDGLAAAAAHELGTPLGTISVVAKELARELDAGSPMAEDVALLQSQTVRCREILQKLSRRGSEQDPMYAYVSVSELIGEAAAPYRERGTAMSISAEPGADAGERGRREPVGMRRPGVIYGFGNLIENAVDFARARVDVQARWSEQSVSVMICDDGPGFQDDVMDTLGEPYVTTRPARDPSAADAGARTGMGLGFFIAKTLLERSGATLTLANAEAPRSGAIVDITWPRAAFEEGAGVVDEKKSVGSAPWARNGSAAPGVHPNR